MSGGYINIQTKGLKQLSDNLGSIAAELRSEAGVKINRAGAAHVLKAAKKNLRRIKRSGTLLRSIYIMKKSKPRAQWVVHYITFRTGKGQKDDGWYAHMVEYGTKPHDIFGKFLSGEGGRRRPMGRDGRFGVYAKHPGATPRLFLTNAFNENTESAVNAMAKRAKQFIEKGK